MATHDATAPSLDLLVCPDRHMSLRAGLDRARRRLRQMAHATRTRRMLAHMDCRELADIGIGPGDAMMEALRRPWDVEPRGACRREG